MIFAALRLLVGVMLLDEPAQVVDREAAAAISEDADRVTLRPEKTPMQRATEQKTARITSRTSDFDRAAGIVMFEGDVIVRYAEDYTLKADQVFMFTASSNEMSRVVALGHVAISNETRYGTCSMATFRRKKNEIEMFGDNEGHVAHLEDRGENASSLMGARIRFWLDSEQVEVQKSSLTIEQGGKGMKLL